MSEKYTIAEVLEFVEHNLPDDVVTSLQGIDAYEFVEARGMARLKMLSDAGVPTSRSQLAALASQIANFLTEAGVEPTPTPAETLMVDVAAMGETTAVPVNPYASLLAGNSSLGLSTAAIMATRMSPQHLLRGAKAVAAYIVLGTGADEVFSEEFFQRLQIEDLSAADAAYQWSKKRRRGDFVLDEDLERLFKAMPDMFGRNWQRVMDTAAQLSSAHAAQSMITGGSFSTNQIANELGAIHTLVPAVAEHMSNQLISSSVPMVAKDAIEMVASLMEVLRNPNLQRAAGVHEEDADVGVIKFLTRTVSIDVANAFRLAVVAERLVLALGACPQSGQIDANYLGVFGQLALQYRTLYELVVGQEVRRSESAQPFRPSEPVAASSQSSVVRRWSFTISLQWRRS